MGTPSSSFRRPSFLSLSALGFAVALVSTGGCTDGFTPGSETGGNVTATGSVTGAGGGAGGGFVATGATSGIGGLVSSGAAPSVGGGPTGSGNGPGAGGGVQGVGGAGTSSGGAPCVDVEPPPDPEWPGATCENWATETEECDKAWFAKYCDASCGRCVPEDGGPGGGTGGAPPCEDKPYPPQPDWPDATCADWATEADACGESWFAGYCDITCGRCVPEAGTGSGGGPSGVDCSSAGLPKVNGGEGFATRYWDCCQPHCAQFDGHRCGQDGIQRTGDSNSACNGGGSFACYDEAPKAVSDCLSYGHIAKANPNCGQCYRIEFTGQGQHNANDPGSKAIKGKQMIVKVTNTGSDVAGNQFDLMVPGGGVGQFNACSRQWGTNDLGAQYGGFLTNCSGSHSAKKDCVRQNCMKIPAGPARDGCLWFVDWLEVADNPKFTSEPTNCPF